MQLFTQSRLSVSKVSPAEWSYILNMAGETAPESKNVDSEMVDGETVLEDTEIEKAAAADTGAMERDHEEAVLEQKIDEAIEEQDAIEDVIEEQDAIDGAIEESEAAIEQAIEESNATAATETLIETDEAVGLSGDAAADVVQNMAEATADAVGQEILTEIREDIREQVGEELAEEMAEEIACEVVEQVRDEIIDQVAEAVNDAITDETEDNIEVPEVPAEAVDEEEANAVAEGIEETLEAAKAIVEGTGVQQDATAASDNAFGDREPFVDGKYFRGASTLAWQCHRDGDIDRFLAV